MTSEETEDFTMEMIKLNNNLECPVVGIGTFMLSPAEAENSVREALKMGYSLVDTANAYVNERACGCGMRDSGKKREEIFLSTKLWPSEYENSNAVDETLERLGVDYVDLLYIHQPAGNWLAGYRDIVSLRRLTRKARQSQSAFLTSRGNTSLNLRKNGRSFRSSSRWKRIRILLRRSFERPWINTASG